MSPESPRPHVDTSVAHSARVYNYWLGGKDNFAADRALGDAMVRAIPSLAAMAKANRAFLRRAVRFLSAEMEIAQFLDIGAGLPTAENVHETAQQINPRSRVLYVDNDPLALTHARALMTSASEGSAEFILGDLRDPRAILADPALDKTLDLHQPIALLLVAVMMHFRDDEGPAGWVSTLVKALPSGSCVVVSHLTGDFAPHAFDTAAAAAGQAGITLVSRGKADLEEQYFAGLEPVEPGVVPIATWRPDGPTPADPHAAYYWAGIARKP